MPHDDCLDLEAADLSEVHIGAEGPGNTSIALAAYLELPPVMLSFDSIESSLCSRELTLPMQAPIARYMKDEDNQRSEDAKESPRVEKEVVTNIEIKRSENAKESHRIEKQVVTEVEKDSD